MGDCGGVGGSVALPPPNPRTNSSEAPTTWLVHFGYTAKRLTDDKEPFSRNWLAGGAGVRGVEEKPTSDPRERERQWPKKWIHGKPFRLHGCPDRIDVP